MTPSNMATTGLILTTVAAGKRGLHLRMRSLNPKLKGSHPSTQKRRLTPSVQHLQLHSEQATPHCAPAKGTEKDKGVSALTRKQHELGGSGPKAIIRKQRELAGCWVRIWEKSRTDED